MPPGFPIASFVICAGFTLSSGSYTILKLDYCYFEYLPDVESDGVLAHVEVEERVAGLQRRAAAVEALQAHVHAIL